MDSIFWEAIGKSGTIIIGIVVILKMIFQFMLKWKDKKNGNNNNKVPAGAFGSAEYTENVKNAIAELDQLWEWHKPDDSGIQQWKNPSFARDIKSVESELKEQTLLITKICTAVENGARQIDDIHTKVMSK